MTKVTGFNMGSDWDGGVTFSVNVTRSPAGVVRHAGRTPGVSDLPQDFREALLDWLMGDK